MAPRYRPGPARLLWRLLLLLLLAGGAALARARQAALGCSPHVLSVDGWDELCEACGLARDGRRELPHGMAGMARLERLRLPRAGLVGQLPPEIADLRNLVELDVAGNALTGFLPGGIVGMSALRVLNVSDNAIEGPLPAGMGAMVALEHLAAGGNRIAGPLPPTLGGAGSPLSVVDLRGNKMSGSVPASLLESPALGQLVLSGNNFTSLMMPNKVVALQVLEISDNSALGPALSKVMLPLGNLRTLRAARCGLARQSVAQAMLALPFLAELDLAGNRLPRVRFDQNLPALRMLNASGNGLEGTLPQLKFAEQLESVDFSRNELVGAIPSSISKLYKLKVIDLSDNKLSGDPSDVLRIRGLRRVSLRGNSFSGPFPDQTRALVELEHLDLSQNRLEGSVPDWVFQDLPRLAFIDLSHNEFYGAVPQAALGPGPMRSLLASHNRFTGRLPKPLEPSMALHVLDLSANELGHAIPDGFGKLEGLRSLNLSRNALSGPVPSSLGECSALEALDLSNNRLSGTLPLELGALPALRTADLAHNYFEGGVPASFAEDVFSLEGNFLQGQPQRPPTTPLPTFAPTPRPSAAPLRGAAPDGPRPATSAPQASTEDKSGGGLMTVDDTESQRPSLVLLFLFGALLGGTVAISLICINGGSMCSDTVRAVDANISERGPARKKPEAGFESEPKTLAGSACVLVTSW